MQAEQTAYGDALERQTATQRYTGPDAGSIAGCIPHPVTYERGWFRTTTAICHGGDDRDGLAFRQRPDGNGIEVRCHTARCTPVWIFPAMEEVIGAPIRTAFEPVEQAPVATAPAPKRWPWQRGALYGGAALALAAPLLLGYSPEVAFLNMTGYAVGALLMGQLALGWQRGGSAHR